MAGRDLHRLVMFEEKNHKKRKNCEIGSIQGSMEDMISKLPKKLICDHILSRLPTADAVKTSALSTRWRNLWKSVPHLGLHSGRFSTSNEFLTSMNKFLYSHKGSLIRKFQLRVFERSFNKEWLNGLYMDDCKDEHDCYVHQWIDYVLRRHEIQHLDFSYGNYVCTNITIPLSLYTYKTLVHLRLVGVNMADAKFVSLPCLKSIYFRFVRFPNVAILEKLISNSPVLEDVTILRSCIHIVDAKPLHLQSQTLEKIYVDDMGSRIQEIVIDAPLLQVLKIKMQGSRIIFSGVSPKVQVNVKLVSLRLSLFSLPLDYVTMILDYLTNISTMVTDLLITRKAFKHIYQISNSVPLPQFGNMSCLNFNLCVSELEWFPTFLESCPNLKSLNMRWYCSSKKGGNMRFESVPKCLLSSLECVFIETNVTKDGLEVKVVKYFLDNAVILKKLTLDLDPNPRKPDIFNEISKFPRRSVTSLLEFL